MATKIDPLYQWNPTSGAVEVLVVLCRWSNHKARALPSQDMIDHILNNAVRQYFFEQSRTRVEFKFTVTDWIDVPFTEDEARTHLDEVIQNLKTYFHSLRLHISPSVYDKWEINKPIILIQSGFDALFPRVSEDGADPKNRLWSGLGFQPLVPGANEPLQRYVITSALHSTAGSVPLRPALICHELSHCFGLPHHALLGDEHYCLMTNLWEFDRSGYRVAPLCTDCKAALGWLEPPAPPPPPADKLDEFNLLPNPNIPDGVIIANSVTIANLRKAVM